MQDSDDVLWTICVYTACHTVFYNQPEDAAESRPAEVLKYFITECANSIDRDASCLEAEGHWVLQQHITCKSNGVVMP